MYCSVARCSLHSFPTRRSSDLNRRIFLAASLGTGLVGAPAARARAQRLPGEEYRGRARADLPTPALLVDLDRKSTRLNSSHRCNSYAVFCLKKKTVLF